MHEGETEPIPRVPRRPRRERPAEVEPDPADDEPPARRARPAGHGHGHTPAPPASGRVRRLLVALLVPFALAALVGTLVLYPYGTSVDSRASAQPVDGVITSTERGGCSTDVEVGEPPPDPNSAPCLLVTVRMSEGPAEGREISTLVPLEPSTPRFAVDDQVVLNYSGGDPNAGVSYQLVDFQRKLPLALLAGLFAIAVLILGRWQGLKALGALAISFLVLVFFVLPAILDGKSPLLVGICGAGVIMFVVLYLTHGLSARTSTAVLGTMVSLAMIGGLGALWAAVAKLTGLDEETATVVGILGHSIDTRGLLLAGVIIGALGVLDDVTVTQTSAVWELRGANPALSARELYAAGLRIGRDHVASAVNTLVMAYAGAALPLLLYSSLSGVGIANIVSSQSIAQEIVRTLVGSIGLVAAVPITTMLAAIVASQEPTPEPATPTPKRPAQRRGNGPPKRRPPDTDPDRRPRPRRRDPDDEPAPRRRRPPGGSDTGPHSQPNRATTTGRRPPADRPTPGPDTGHWDPAVLDQPPAPGPQRRGSTDSGQWFGIDQPAPNPRHRPDYDTGQWSPRPTPPPRNGPDTGQWFGDDAPQPDITRRGAPAPQRRPNQEPRRRPGPPRDHPQAW